MLLSRTYSYINQNGDRESTRFKMSPSTLKRANVPVELIREYNEANSALQQCAHSYDSENSEKVREFQIYQQANFEALNKIDSFLANQELLNFGEVDIKAIRRLLDSEVTANKIEKDTGVSRNTLGKIKNGKADLLNIQLRSAMILTQYAHSNKV